MEKSCKIHNLIKEFFTPTTALDNSIHLNLFSEFFFLNGNSDSGGISTKCIVTILLAVDCITIYKKKNENRQFAF